MMKTLKWFDGGKSNNSTEEKKEHDHPITVEFPSPVEDNDDGHTNNPHPVGTGGSASSSDHPKLQNTHNGHHDNNNNNNNSSHVENNNNSRSNLLRRISEGDSEEGKEYEPSSMLMPVPYRNNNSDDDDDDEGYQDDDLNDSNPAIIDESIAGGRYGARPSMRCSTSSMEEDIEGESKIDNSHPNNSINKAIVPTNGGGGGKQQRKSMTTFIGRSASTGTVGSSSKPMGGGAVAATGVAIGGSANSGGSSSTPTFQRKGSGGMNNNEREEEDDDYDVRAAFETEHKAVRKFKVVVVVVLVAAAVAVSAVVYRFTSNGERQNLDREYNDYADKFITNFHHLAIMRQWAAYTVAAQYTGKLLDNHGPEKKPWPNATLPDFHDQVRGALVLAHGVNIEFSPFFPNDKAIRSEWEAYAVENEAMVKFVPEWAKRHSGGHGDHGGGDHGAAMDHGDHGAMDKGDHGAGDHGAMDQGNGAGDHGAMDHGAAMDPQANTMDGTTEHDMGGGSNNMGDHDMGGTSSSSMHPIDDTWDMGPDENEAIEFANGGNENDFGPDMNEALEIANGKRLLRGRILQDEHGHGDDHSMSNAETATTEEAHETANTEEAHHILTDHKGDSIEAGHDHGEHMASMSMANNLKKYDDGGCISINELSKDLLPSSWGGSGHAFEHPSRPIDEGIYTMDGLNIVDETHNATEMPWVAPSWQIHPLIGNEGRVMYNEYSDCHRRRAINTMIKTGGPAMTEVLVGFEDFHHFFDEPASNLMYPVFNHFEEENKSMVGFVTVTFHWLGTFWNILPQNIVGIVAVIETSTGQKSSFRVNGKHGIFVGEGDYHDKKWGHMRRSSSVYRVYAKESDVKEMVGHHRDLFRYLEELDVGADENSDSEDLVDGEHIDFKIHIYPSDDFEASYLTNQPKIFSLAVSLVFLVTVITFIVYDILVEKRQKKLLQNAQRSNKVVASLFPAMVRERLFQDSEPLTREDERVINTAKRSIFKASSFLAPPPNQSHSQAGDSDTATAVSGSAPAIADLYNDTTVLFADIAGFTAWSSEREPRQVFQLLESLFCEFDAEAKSMKVFKIETIGDCYVAVTGLPEANPNHAVIMAKFAQRCLLRFGELTKELELSLGPGTADLGIRIGMHSGPVTAGVLRGEKARFQLFGDTMNTASRMESTSIKNMIQVTADTAALLKKSGKGHTLIAREGLIKAKGKGYMQTYWLRPKSSYSTDSTSNLSERLDFLQVSHHEVSHIHSRAQHDAEREKLGLPSFSHSQQDSMTEKLTLQQDLVHSWNDTGFSDISKNGGLNRLIQWNAAVLESILVKILVQRNELERQNGRAKDVVDVLELTTGVEPAVQHSRVEGSRDEYNDSALFHEEIATAVKMPPFDREAMSAACLMPSNEKVNLIPSKARDELHIFVARIASMYQDVHFHNFEHASHVTMSAQKLINKVVLRNSTDMNHNLLSSKKKDLSKKKEEADLFFSTYGISSDPLAQFAVVFAALVHDVEHKGVPNVQLIKEQPDLAMKYKNKSVAENNSIRIALNEFLKSEFANLRSCIFRGDGDEARFRQLLINVVIATDITDRERRAGESERWEQAFLSDGDGDGFNWEKEWQNKSEDKLPQIDVSLKATVVLEQIVLASDVAHTMQHWLTYVKWNERLYKEMWAAYASGRAEKDPTEGWYKGEIGFFDGYIIPLATKLKECGVFGNAGDEYLGNALRNKAEWIEKGQAIVAEFEAKIKRKSDVGITQDKRASSSSSIA